MNQRWVPIQGNAKIADNEISLIHIPPPPTTPSPQPNFSLALIRSNIEFERGTIELQVCLPDPNCSCLIGLNGQQGDILYGGLNTNGVPYGFSVYRNNLWVPLASAGQGGQPKFNEWIDMRLQAHGSNLDLFINQVKVLSTSFLLTRGPVNLYMYGPSKITAKDIKIKTQKPICFVVMQFTEEFNALFSEVIRPTCEDFDYEVVRADDFYNSGLILEDITRSIKECTIVIADVTPNNANVFYEVGFAHGIGKPTILLSDRKREKLPFDISGFRTLFYDNTIAGKRTVQEKLKKHLEAIKI